MLPRVGLMPHQCVTVPPIGAFLCPVKFAKKMGILVILNLISIRISDKNAMSMSLSDYNYCTGYIYLSTIVLRIYPIFKL